MPSLKIPEKLEPLLHPKQFKIIYGGRGGAKSMSIAGILLMRIQTEGIKVGAMREMMNSIDDSVHSLFQEEISRLELSGFTVKHNSITHENGGQITYKGLARNPDSVKSMHGFDVFWIEEASTLSQRSIDLLIPTLRKHGAELWISFNPGSREDPTSKEFLIPFEKKLDYDGCYSDDLHTIIRINYMDNPFFPKNLDDLRRKHYEEKSREWYNHTWLGDWDDTVEDALIHAEWMDACIDAHIKLGFKPIGAKMASHDPSDLGPDAKGFAYRHGSVVLAVEEKTTGNINEGGDWAVDLALKYGVDAFTWDCDGMGVGLNRQITKAFDGKHTVLSMFKGSEGPDNPDAIYQPPGESGLQDQKTVKEVCKNKRAQYALELRDRVYKTYRAVEYGEYYDPDKLISFSSDIKAMTQLRAELCRMPVKPNGNGRFELYTKPEMKSKFKFKSPNLFDSVMMLMRSVRKTTVPYKMPKPLRPLGRR